MEEGTPMPNIQEKKAALLKQLENDVIQSRMQNSMSANNFTWESLDVRNE